VTEVVARIRAARDRVPATRSLLVAVSGIDASGKGYVTARIAATLEAGGLRPAVINADGWLNLPHLRFDPFRPAEHFYERAIRFDALFELLVLPLRARRSVRLSADHAEETAAAFRPRLYEFSDVDVILLEGIFLLKREYRPLYDLSVWVDCSFETALERAVARGQEGLSPAATVAAYLSIYFPAQRIHLERDDPRAASDIRVANDSPNPGRHTRIETAAGVDPAVPPSWRLEGAVS
jgi:uridine kinase